MQYVLRDIRQPEHVLLGPFGKADMIKALIEKGPLNDAQLFKWIPRTEVAHDKAYQKFRREFLRSGFSEDDANRAADEQFMEEYGIEPYDLKPSPDADILFTGYK